MKKIAVKYCMLLFVLAICLGSCKEEEVYTTFPAPVWQVDDAKIFGEYDSCRCITGEFADLLSDE